MRKCDGMCAFQHSQCDSIETKTSTSVGAVTEQCSASLVLCLQFLLKNLGIHLDLRIMGLCKRNTKQRSDFQESSRNTITDVQGGTLAAAENTLIKCAV